MTDTTYTTDLAAVTTADAALIARVADIIGVDMSDVLAGQPSDDWLRWREWGGRNKMVRYVDQLKAAGLAAFRSDRDGVLGVRRSIALRNW